MLEKQGGGGSCCSPGCSPLYLSTVCHHVSSLFVATSSASCVKKKQVGESLTGISVDSDDMCCHREEHGKSVNMPGHLQYVYLNGVCQ